MRHTLPCSLWPFTASALRGQTRLGYAGSRGQALPCGTWRRDIVPSVPSLDPVDPDVDLHVSLDRSELVRHHASVLGAIAAGNQPH